MCCSCSCSLLFKAEELDEDAVARRQREAMRADRKREREREMRLDNMKVGKRRARACLARVSRVSLIDGVGGRRTTRAVCRRSLSPRVVSCILCLVYVV